jgi:anti-anti-sigma regulatory factor
MDAAGMGELVACRALARAAGAEFRLCGVSGKARELLLLTGLDRKLLNGPRRPLHDLKFRIA